MKRLYFTKFLLLIVVLLGSVHAIAQPPVVFTFSSSNLIQTYTVPFGVTTLTIDAQGARGGLTSYTPTTQPYAQGALVHCTIAVTPGQVFYAVMGDVGLDGTTTTSNVNHQGGYNGGGNGVDLGGGGGGATDLRFGGTAITNRVVVAAGGGGWGGGYSTSTLGATPPYNPGGCGGLTGEGGYYNSSGTSGSAVVNAGRGATGSAGGAKATSTGGAFSLTTIATDGALGQGGNGGTNNQTGYGGGGGGGGYYGGGGGVAGGGGGGSSYTNPTYVNAASVTVTSCVGDGVGKLTINTDCAVAVAGAVVGPKAICAGLGATYTNPTGSGGGVWSVTPSGVLSIDPVTGVATTPPNAPFTVVTIKQTTSYACNPTAIATTPSYTVTVNPLPDAIIAPSGGAVVCRGSDIYLYDNPNTGTWSTSNPLIASIFSPGPGIVDVNGGGGGTSSLYDTIVYTLGTGCKQSIVVTVNPVPAAITGVNSVCQYGTAQLIDTSAGGVWSSDGSVYVDASGNVNTTSPGTGNIYYSYTTSTCLVSKSFTVNALPISFPFTEPGGTDTRCSNGPGIEIQLQTTAGVYYQLYRNGVKYGGDSVLSSSGGPLSFGFITDSGTYTAVGSNNGCRTAMANSARINTVPSPAAYPFSVVGSTTFCVNGTIPYIVTSGSDNNSSINYVLTWNGGDLASLTGTGGPLDYSTSGAAGFAQRGVYAIYAKDISNQCITNMPGSYTFNPLPVPQVDTLIGGGNFCPGGTGVTIGIKNSVAGINYQLYQIGSGPKGAAIPGSGAGFSFGKQTGIGDYNAIATNSTSGCSTEMYPGTAAATKIHVDTNARPHISTLSLTGPGNICANSTTGAQLKLDSTVANVNYQLYNGTNPTGGIAATTGTGSYNLPAQFAAGSYTAYATDAFTGCTIKMNGAPVISIDNIPTAETVSGGGSYCLNQPGVVITVAPSQSGVTYYLYDASGNPVSSPAPISGTGGTISFDPQTLVGNYTVTAKNSINTCINKMNGVASVGTLALPAQYPVLGGGNYCIGGGGSYISLQNSTVGVDYRVLLNGTTPATAYIGGSNSGLNFGQFLPTGTYTVVGMNHSTGCIDTMSNAVVVTNSPAPAVYMVTAGGSSYCAGGTGVDVALSSSETGINYQFYRTGVPVGSVVAGTGLALDYGMQVLPGTYSIKATNPLTGCAADMFGMASVSINSLPNQYNVTGGGNYCSGSAGAHVSIDNSDTGINYQLYVGGIPAEAAVAGTGLPLDLGAQKVAGTYMVIATNAHTTCVNNMMGSVTVSVVPLPAAYNVTGGGNICSGSTGTAVNLSGSQLDVTYQLYINGIASGTALGSSTGARTFGMQNTAGVYTIMGTNPATGCTTKMTDSAVISVLPLPAAYTLSGGGTYCAGVAASHVMSSGSTIGVNYQLMNGSAPVGTFVTGAAGPLDFGAPVASGTYNVLATDAITGCTSNMIAPVVYTFNPLPAMDSISGGGHYCITGSGVHIGMANSVAGIKYQLNRGGAAVGTTIPGAGSPIDFGFQKIAGTYTVTGINTVTGCSQTMAGSTNVIVDSILPASVTIASSAASDTVCAGSSYTFTASSVHGGTAPFYSWSVNGGPAIYYGPTYYYVPVNGDILSVMLNSSDACAIPAVATANVVMTVVPFAVPSATISVSPAATICAGTPATFTATALNGGFAPSYIWYKNSVAVASGSTYTYTPTDKDVVIAKLYSSYTCLLPKDDSVFSNTFNVAVDAAAPPVVTITATQGTTLAAGQVDTFIASATNAGLAPKYQWSNNGAAISGATNAIYIGNEFFNNDMLTCNVTSSNACGLSSFNSVVITINRGTTGISQVSSAADIRVMPNPNKGDFSIKGNTGALQDGEVTMEITNMLGQVIYSNKTVSRSGMINEHVSLGNVAGGMYLLNVRSATGNNVYHIVIEQ